VAININRSVFGDSDDNGSGGVVDADSVTGTTVNFNTLAFAQSFNDNLADVKGGAATVNVNGFAFVAGFVNLTANNDTFTIGEGGFWQAAQRNSGVNNLTSDFGAGANDTLIINGSDVVGDGTLSAAGFNGADQFTTLANLEVFTSNGGDINMQDFKEGDVLTAPVAAYFGGTTAGGDDADLEVDAFLGAPGSRSDELRVASTGGVTGIEIQDTNGGVGAFNPDGIIVVRTNPGASAATHFTLELADYNGNGDVSGGTIDKGLFFYDLFFRPNTLEGVVNAGVQEDQHLLAGLPDGEVFQLGSIPAQMQAHFHAQAGDWLSRNVDLRENEGAKGKDWNFFLKSYGSWQDRENTAAFSFLNKSFSFDVSYDQNNFGVLGGLAYSKQLEGEAKLRTGVFGGYTEFDSEFVPLKGSITTVDADGYGLGAFVSYTSPEWFFDAFFKADFLNLDISIPSLVGFGEDSAGPSGNNYGGVLEAGYKHPINNMLDGTVFASATYVQSRIEEVSLGGSTIDFGSNESLRGRLGVGLDAKLAENAAQRFVGGVSVAAIHEFLGENEVRILSAGPVFTAEDEFDETLAQISGRLEYSDLTSGLSAFVKADYEFNGDYEDIRVSAGLRVPFTAPE
ncbi:MAG TPA: hypothetical protein DCL48_00250, partial [Alphaproteobacteria bacterium]|nr:hypothetical protein [Alphaproteobacteria bacterium]